MVLGYVIAILIGVSLGLIGAGGSILAVPVLVYLMAVPPVLATSYSLFIVGISAMAASYSYWKNKLLNFKMAVLFGLPSVVGILISRKLLFPAIPKELFAIGKFMVTKDFGIMMLLASLMIPAATKMIQKTPPAKASDVDGSKKPSSIIPLMGLVVGLIAGLVGVGGGFLIIPVLVVVAGQPMKSAIGTSLFIIAVNSLIGFSGDLTNDVPIDWHFLFIFSSFALAGIFVGTYLSKFISGQKLKPIFGWVVMLVGIYIIADKLFHS